ITPRTRATLLPYTTLFRSEHAGHRRLALFTEDLLQVLHHLARLAVLQREHAHRHARHPVDVEDADGAQVVLQLGAAAGDGDDVRSEEHTSELQSRENLVCR